MISVLYYIAYSLSLLALATWRALKYLERASYWTLRLRISIIEPYLLTAWALSTCLAVVHYLLNPPDDSTREPFKPDIRSNVPGTIRWLLVGTAIILTIDLCFKTLQDIPYLNLRWKAWSGPSRTGIPADMASYVGSAEDWKTMTAQCLTIPSDPVDRYSGNFGVSRGKIEWDPTAILRAWSTTEKDVGFARRAQVQDKDGVYHPIFQDASISLLWGEDLGFRRRCSRGIISVPSYLLAASPTMPSGTPAKALCLAYAILSRNKGLDPRSLICNLKKNNTFRQWEEVGIWPHPAKTLRGFYYTELSSAFSLLGEPYVTAATELALLLADLDHAHVEYWLDNKFEHQDLEFNRLAHAHGATAADLDRLYRGQYAAMLISLNMVTSRPSLRPELAVFEAVCGLEEVVVPDWVASPAMQARRDAELQAYGVSLKQAVRALV